MLQATDPKDYVIDMGEVHSVCEFCEAAFAADLDYRDFVALDRRFRRPAEAVVLRGDTSKAEKMFGCHGALRVRAVA